MSTQLSNVSGGENAGRVWEQAGEVADAAREIARIAGEVAEGAEAQTRSLDAAVSLANDSPFGLTASVWTRDLRRGRRVASRIEAGTVMVNEVLYTHGIAQTPWGGVKQSGLGRTHGRLGLLEMVAPHHVHVNRLAFLQDVWWFGYSAEAADLFRSLARRFATGSALQTSLVMPQLLRRVLGHRKR